MALYASDSGPKRDPIPAGPTASICYSIVDLGNQFNEQFQKMNRQVMFTFECPEHRVEIEKDGKKLDLPRAISATFTLSLSPKAKLKPFLEGWRGKPFDATEMEAFDVQSFLGKPALLNVVHGASNKGKVFANIGSIMPLPKTMISAIGKAENPLVSFEIDNLAAGIPESIPEWVRGKIQESAEYKARKGSILDHTAQSFPEDDKSGVPF